MDAVVFDKLYTVATDKALAESGGGHNAKGIEFQKYWAITRLIELTQSGENDFLFLFEAIQDVAVLNSTTSPTKIDVYQVKKKDRGEWTWSELITLPQPDDPGKPKKIVAKPKVGVTAKVKVPAEIKNSPIGKLYASMHALKGLKSSARFISNAGCNLTLANGSNAATSLPTKLSELPAHQVSFLLKELEIFHQNGEPVPDLSRLYVERVALSPDSPKTQVIGLVHSFLSSRSKRHAGQAESFVDALLIRIGPLGAKTDTCKSFDEIRVQHGYSKEEFDEALGALEELPDIVDILNTWLATLATEGMGVLDTTGIRIAAASIYKRQLMGTKSKQDAEAIRHCDIWLANKNVPNKLMNFFEEGYNQLKDNIALKKTEVLAHFALRAIEKCIAQI